MKEFSSTISTTTVIQLYLPSLISIFLLKNPNKNSDSVIRELTSALQQSNREKMGDTKVETISRLAQWKIDNFGPCSYKKFDSFKLGLWNWFFFLSILSFLILAIKKNRYLNVRLFPEPSRQSKDQPPLARFILRVSNLGISRRPYISPGLLDFCWLFETVALLLLLVVYSEMLVWFEMLMMRCFKLLSGCMVLICCHVAGLIIKHVAACLLLLLPYVLVRSMFFLGATDLML